MRAIEFDNTSCSAGLYVEGFVSDPWWQGRGVSVDLIWV